MRKHQSKKGFTLAELLIVVAIIAVLVAIAIPVFSAQLEKSRDATSIANIRKAYDEAQIQLMERGAESGDAKEIYELKNTTIVIESTEKNNWSNIGSNLPFVPPSDPGEKGKYKITFITLGNRGGVDLSKPPSLEKVPDKGDINTGDTPVDDGSISTVSGVNGRTSN